MKNASHQILAVHFPEAGLSNLADFAVPIRHLPVAGEPASSNRPIEPRELAALPTESVSPYRAFHHLAH